MNVMPDVASTRSRLSGASTQDDDSAPQRRLRPRFRRWLFAIVAVGVALRFAWGAVFTVAMNGEGAEYARIAENLLAGRGYVGIATEGVELMFPPLYPLSIAAVSLAVGSSFLAAALVSLAAGAGLLLAVFAISRALHGDRAAIVAVGLAALQPVLIKLSAAPWMEGCYTTLLLTSAYLALRAQGSDRRLPWALAGASAGLAYLMSPQAVVLPVLFAVSSLLTSRTRRHLTIINALVLALSFTVVAAPYVVFLSRSTGAFRIEGKTIVNNELGRRVLAGVPECTAGYGVTDDLEPTGVWMRPNLDVARAAGRADYASMLAIMFSRGFGNLSKVARAFLRDSYLGGPLLIILAALGLFWSVRSSHQVAGSLVLILVTLGAMAPLMTQIHQFQERYYLVFVPLLVIWAANGIVHSSEWARRLFSDRGVAAPPPRLAALAEAVPIGCLLILFAVGFGKTRTFRADSSPIAAALREAGDWLARVPGPKTVMDTDTPIAFHAGASYVPMPCSSAATALRFAERKGVDYVVLKSWLLGTRPYLQDWWDHGIPGARASLVHSAGATPGERVLIYALKETGARPGAGPRAAAGGTHRLDGPLRTSSLNRRYLGGPDGRPIYLAGLHTWANLQDRGPTDPPPRFNYKEFLDLLEHYGLNFFRLWSWENAAWAPWTNGDFHFDPMPFERTGPGLALDGKPRFDLTRLDRAYFDRLQARVRLARDRGIFVSVMLFNGFSVERKGLRRGNPWLGHPFNASNNVNGVDGDRNGNGEGEETHTLEIPEVVRYQETYVRAVVDALNDFDNVVFEISNESDARSVAWQYHMIDLIKEYESSKPKQHAVGMTSTYPDGDNENLLRSPADWISPNRGKEDFLVRPPPADGRKVVISDTDHLCGECSVRDWVWKSATAGYSTLYMDGFREKDFTHPAVLDVRRSLALSAAVLGEMNLAAAVPDGKASSTGYCLASRAAGGDEYLIYAPSRASTYQRLRRSFIGKLFERRETVSVNLEATPHSLAVDWLDPATGVHRDGGIIAGGTVRMLRAPVAGDAVLHLRPATVNAAPNK